MGDGVLLVQPVNNDPRIRPKSLILALEVRPSRLVRACWALDIVAVMAKAEIHSRR